MGERFRKFAERYKRARVITDAVGIAPPFEEREAAFREYYSGSQQRLRAAEKTFRNLVQLLLSDIGIEEPKVDSRLSAAEKCLSGLDGQQRRK
ncbi:hypothetical protein ACFQZO_21145 [Bradyrhizobium sp. GCM10027634]|uniref:hypothetical protein n=1 Tax=unclassified Bradyrhizobium TaxID=2631580 RepID=UPI00188D2816|nr:MULTISPECIES: hypothetical protein [unclassified Bradyrhizobium]MDN5003346.1 hypothetical protein [Bradyrhizobium sp. WYCCWR 12677]